ncbi:MAG: ribonuclease E/G, partial [Mycobacterium sp.]|nr:ribonuclease E/G [Mycobacterium sp.]
SNRDLVLRRLTEALARDRTRHQVSEVTSLGLVQLTRKRLGTGLVEAFSTSCPQCSGRGIILHVDPVDSSAASGRKSDSTGRRGRRSKKSRSDEPVVAKVPAHAPGEHPMFKAMAAANGRHDGEPGGSDEELVDASANRASHDESEAEAEEQVADEVAEDLDDNDEDFDDSDDDEVDLDEDEDLGEDEELDIDDDDLDVDDDSDDEDSDDAKNTGSADREHTAVAAASAPAHPRRRRAAIRPAGPPTHGD